MKKVKLQWHIYVHYEAIWIYYYNLIDNNRLL